MRALALIAALIAPLPAAAHHSFAMYDTAEVITLPGTVQEFQWTNPHAILWVLGSAHAGDPPEQWTIELPTSPGNLSRLGWTKHSLSPGDQVILEFNPLRDGKRGGSFRKITVVATGKTYLVNLRDQPKLEAETK